MLHSFFTFENKEDDFEISPNRLMTWFGLSVRRSRLRNTQPGNTLLHSCSWRILLCFNTRILTTSRNQQPSGMESRDIEFYVTRWRNRGGLDGRTNSMGSEWISFLGTSDREIEMIE